MNFTEADPSAGPNAAPVSFAASSIASGAGASTDTAGNFDWNKPFSEGRRLWGGDPSIVGVTAAEYLLTDPSANPTVIGVGIGYGRDENFLLKTIPNISVIGIDIADAGIAMAKSDMRDFINDGHAHFIVSDYCSERPNILLQNGRADAVISHRMWHLLTEEEADKFAEQSNMKLADNGLLIVSARSVDDFKPESMRRLPDGRVENLDMPGHYIRMATEQSLRESFEKHGFVVERIFKNQEPETYQADGTPSAKITHTLVVVARKASAASPAPVAA